MGQFGDALFHFAQWVDLAAVLILAGGCVFLLVVWRPSATAARPPTVESMFLKRGRRLVVAAWVVAVSASIPLVIRAGPLGLEGLRLGLLVVGGLALLASQGFRLRGDSVGSGALPAMVGSAALLSLLLSAALTGHARGSALPLPNLMVALIHVTAAAAWVGGLVVLVAIAFPSVRGVVENDRAALLAPVVARFSDLAVWSVAAVVASGTYSAWMEIRGLGAVTASTYGLVFLAKLGAFLPVLALGGINNRWTKPRLVSAVRDQTPTKSSLILLRRMVAVEIGLIAVVLALTVLLLELSPPAISGAGHN
jgi:copper transport protein